jgi:hypothetical protein
METSTALAIVLVCYFGSPVLIYLGHRWATRTPGSSRQPRVRKADKAEKILIGFGMLLTAVTAAEPYLMNGVFLAAIGAYWLNILPLTWLALTLYRKDIPGDLTATRVGLWTLAPYVACIISFKEPPESMWLSLFLFGWAFVIGTWRDMRRPD